MAPKAKAELSEAAKDEAKIAKDFDKVIQAAFRGEQSFSEAEAIALRDSLPECSYTRNYKAKHNGALPLETRSHYPVRVIGGRLRSFWPNSESNRPNGPAPEVIGE